MGTAAAVHAKTRAALSNGKKVTYGDTSITHRRYNGEQAPSAPTHPGANRSRYLSLPISLTQWSPPPRISAPRRPSAPPPPARTRPGKVLSLAQSVVSDGSARIQAPGVALAPLARRGIIARSGELSWDEADELLSLECVPAPPSALPDRTQSRQPQTYQHTRVMSATTLLIITFRATSRNENVRRRGPARRRNGARSAWSDPARGHLIQDLTLTLTRTPVPCIGEEHASMDVHVVDAHTAGRICAPDRRSHPRRDGRVHRRQNRRGLRQHLRKTATRITPLSSN